MSQGTIDTIKAFTAPALLAVVLALSAMLWTDSQARIAALESQLQTAQGALGIITENQKNSAESRVEFQEATTRRLDRMEDVLGAVSQSLTRLAALQEAQPTKR